MNFVKSFIIGNISGILFVGIIIFAISAITFSHLQKKPQAQTLITYAEDTGPALRIPIENFVTEYSQADNTEEVYDNAIADLNSIADDSLAWANTIPSNPSDEDSVALQDSLARLSRVTALNANRLATFYTLEKESLAIRETYANIRSVVREKGEYSQLELSIEAGKTLNNTLLVQAENATTDEERAQLQTRYNDEKILLDAVENILTGKSNTLTDQDADAISEIYSQGWPAAPFIFPSPAVESLETQEFIRQVLLIEDLMVAVRERHDL